MHHYKVGYFFSYPHWRKKGQADQSFVYQYSITSMSDPNNPNAKKRDTEQWSLYQRENFWKPNTGEVPLFNTEPGKLEELAKQKLSEGGW